MIGKMIKNNIERLPTVQRKSPSVITDGLFHRGYNNLIMEQSQFS